MTDRELLEMAAKAAGIKGHFVEQCPEDGHPRYRCGIGKDGVFFDAWNPLAYDGDALSLAAELRLHIKPGKHKGDGCTVETQRDGITGCTAFYDDKAQQMRQAIVRASAEIGKAMP